MGDFSAMGIARRGRLYNLRRRVPRRYRGIEPRETIWISLCTGCKTIARSRADRVQHLFGALHFGAGCAEFALVFRYPWVKSSTLG